MRFPYRNETDALAAQCESLRRDLERAQAGSAELEKIRKQLESKLKELEAARLSEAEQSDGAKRVGRQGLRRGLIAGMALAFGLLVAGRWAGSRAPAPPPPKVVTEAAWFTHARPHCNPVEVRLEVERRPPPPGNLGAAYLAGCYALAGQIDLAKRTLDALPVTARAGAAGRVFDIAHPIADAGDDKATGPIMELVLDYTPGNFQAVYHAGMAEYAIGQHDLARSRLEQFLTMYSPEDGWRHRAKEVLGKLGAAP